MLEFNNLFKERLRLHSPILASLEKLRLRRKYSVIIKKILFAFGVPTGLTTRSSVLFGRACSRFAAVLTEGTTRVTSHLQT